MSTITVTFAPHAVNGWFVKIAARPIVSVDGHVTEGSWSTPMTIDAPDAASQVAAGIRYRWLLKKNLLGPAVTTQPGARLTAANGTRNGAPFELS